MQQSEILQSPLMMYIDQVLDRHIFSVAAVVNAFFQQHS